MMREPSFDQVDYGGPLPDEYVELEELGLSEDQQYLLDTILPPGYDITSSFSYSSRDSSGLYNR